MEATRLVLHTSLGAKKKTFTPTKAVTLRAEFASVNRCNMAISKMKTDLMFADYGSIWLMFALTESGTEWIEDRIPDNAQTLGKAIAIEHRYVRDIVEGASGDGLNCEVN